MFDIVLSPKASESLSIASYFQSQSGSEVETSEKAEFEVKDIAKAKIKAKLKRHNQHPGSNGNLIKYLGHILNLTHPCYPFHFFRDYNSIARIKPR